MGPIAATGTAFAKAFNFGGRASRSEFWWFFLFAFLIQAGTLAYDVIAILPLILAEDLAALLSLSPFDFLYVWASIILFVPLISIQFRRLHDAGFSGFWWLLTFVPLGALVLLVMYVIPSTDDTGAWGAPSASSTPSWSAAVGRTKSKGKSAVLSDQQRAFQGYACLFENDRPVTPETVASRKAEISEYYRSKVLKAV